MIGIRVEESCARRRAVVRRAMAVGLLVVPGLTGCTTTIATSSSEHLAAEQSSVTVDGAADTVLPELVVLFQKRGLQLIDRRPGASGGEIFEFKGQRETVNVQIVTGSGGYGYGGGASTINDSSTVGSVVYVRAVRDGSRTRLDFLGKPVVSQAEVCSPADWAEIQCDGVRTGKAWPGLSMTTGREEADLIRGVITELTLEDSGAGG